MSTNKELAEKYLKELENLKGTKGAEVRIQKLNTKLKTLGVFESEESSPVNSESNKSEIELMTQESLEKELKSVVFILKNSTDPEMIQYKNELELEILKRKSAKISDDGPKVKKYYSELLKMELFLDLESQIMTTEDGVKYSASEILNMRDDNFTPDDVMRSYFLKKEFKTATYQGKIFEEAR